MLQICSDFWILYPIGTHMVLILGWIVEASFKETMIDARGTACKHCYGGFAFRQPSRNNSGIKGRDLGENAFRF